MKNKIPPPIIFLLSAGLMWWLGGFPGPWQLMFASKTPVAIGLLATGLAFDLLAIGHFWRAKTTVNPLKPQNASNLIVSGVYRLTRNPMYLGLLLNLLAWAVYLGNVLTIAGPILFVAYINRFQIKPEERALEILFGSDYRAYQRKVRRWL